jgi:hypothetical protein
MELPIQVIVVLFVALIVGGAIVAFSQQSLRNAQETLNERWREDPANKQLVVDVVEADEGTILSLANECVRKSQGVVAEQTTCFAVFSPSFTDLASLNDRELLEGFKLNTTGAPDTPQAVRITYNPAGTVEVS